MSWLSDIAGKAENFLNAMDKGAASAISQATNVVQQAASSPLGSRAPSVTSSSARKYSFKSDFDFSNDAEYIETPDIMSLKTSASTNSLYSTNGNGNGHSNAFTKGHQRTSSYDSVGSRGSKVDDDRLMDYLNSKENNIPEEEWRPLDDSQTTTVEHGVDEVENHSQKSHDSDHSESNQSTSSNRSSKLAKLNQVKIEALSKELTNLQKRYSELISEYKNIQRKAISYHNINLTNEKHLKELKSKESDLQATISAKDSQVAALKVQIEQTDSELRQKHEKLIHLEEISSELQNLVNQKPALDQEVVNNLEGEIVNLKQSLKEERDELKRIQDSNREQVNRLEDNQRSLIDEIENCRRAVVEAKNAKAEAEFASGSLQKRMESLESEYSEFKLKANKTLQDKDELIRALRSDNKEDLELQKSGSTVSSDRLRVLQEQYDSLVRELGDLQAKYDSAKLAAEKAENETIPRQEYEIKSLQDQLKSEQSVSTNLKTDVRQLTEESKQYQDDLNQIRTNLSARIAERDDEIEKLRKQLVLKQQRGGGQSSSAQLLQAASSLPSSPSNSASAEEWEQRLKTLTENLIQKQATVEQLSSANHSLKLQLERSEQRLREMASSGASINNDVAIGIYHSPTFTNYIKHRMHNNQSDGSLVPLMEDNPNDGQVTRKVKRAYGAIDAFSIRLGNFLRVYPSARAAFLVYIVVLHLWVAFVLIYYEPEVHTPDFHSKKGL